MKDQVKLRRHEKKPNDKANSLEIESALQSESVREWIQEETTSSFSSRTTRSRNNTTNIPLNLLIPRCISIASSGLKWASSVTLDTPLTSLDPNLLNDLRETALQAEHYLAKLEHLSLQIIGKTIIGNK